MRFNRFISLFVVVVVVVCLLLNLLKTKAKRKVGNFNRGECLGSPHTGYEPVI